MSLGEEEYDNSLDKELKFHISANIGGMYENRQYWTVDFEVDESLAVNIQDINGDTILALPASFYTLSPTSQVTIPSEVRHILNLKEGHKMILIVNNNEIILVPKVLDPMNNIGILGEEEETFSFREKLDHYKSGA